MNRRFSLAAPKARAVMFTMLLAGLMVYPGRLRAEGETAAPGAGKAAYTFDQAIQNYLKGDSQQAIQQLDEVVGMEPSNQRAKVFLLKILVERGSRLFLAKNYQKAYEYLGRAYNMDPDNQQVRQMFDIAAKQVAPPKPVTKVMLIPKEMQNEMLKQEAAQQAQGAGMAATASLPANSAHPGSQAGQNRAAAMTVYAEAAPLESRNGAAAAAGAGMTEEYAKNVTAMMELMSSFQRRQEQQISQFMVPLDRLQNLYYQSEKDRKNFINQLDQRFKSVLGDVSFQQRMVIYGFIAGLILLGVVIWGFYLAIMRMRSKREETIMKYQQEMLKMVRDMAGLPGGNPYASLPMGNANYRLAGMSAPQLITGPAMGNPGRVNPMDTGGQKTDPLNDLERITNTGNYKERAMAAVQMLGLDAERALGVISSMLTDPDPFQRENMAFALGQQYHPLTLDLLLAALKDSELRVVNAACRALKKLEQQPEDTLPGEARDVVRNALKNLPPNLQVK